MARKNTILDVRLTRMFNTPYDADIIVKSYSIRAGDKDNIPALSCQCMSPDELDYWLKEIEKDIANIRRKVSKFFTRPTSHAPDAALAAVKPGDTTPETESVKTAGTQPRR